MTTLIYSVSQLSPSFKKWIEILEPHSSVKMQPAFVSLKCKAIKYSVKLHCMATSVQTYILSGAIVIEVAQGISGLEFLILQHWLSDNSVCLTLCSVYIYLSVFQHENASMCSASSIMHPALTSSLSVNCKMEWMPIFLMTCLKIRYGCNVWASENCSTVCLVFWGFFLLQSPSILVIHLTN